MPTTLLHSTADIIHQVLIDLGLGSNPSQDTAWPVYTAGEPDIPDNCITVYDTTGTNDGRVMTDGELQTHNGVQIRIRSVTHAAGWAKADAIQTGLAKSVRNMNVSLDTSEYLVYCIANIGNILVLGKEVSPSSTRKLFTINAVVSVDQAL